MLMMRLFGWLFGSASRLNPLELHIINAAKGGLTEEAALLLQQQVDAVNMVQRLSKGKEVNLYSMRRGKAVFDDVLRFPATADEAHLATVRLRHPEKRATLRSELWLAKGRLFSVLFSIPPKEFLERFDARSILPTMTEVSIHFDPMKKLVLPTRPVDPSSLRGWIKEWHDGGLIGNLHDPLSETERAKKLASLNALLPPDYLEFVSQTEGAIYASSIIVHGLTGIRKVVGPEDNNYVLAEDASSFTLLTVREGAQGPDLHFLHPDYPPSEAGESFAEAMKNWPQTWTRTP
jgi:hypothetical protein